MNIDLNSPLSWKRAYEAGDPGSAAELAMLNDLQGNILKGHGRHFTSNLFLKFDPSRAEEVNAFLAEMGGLVTTALHQLIQTDLYKCGASSSSTFVAMMLSASGYDAIGRQDAMPQGEAFRAGMKRRELADAPVASWDAHFAGQVDAMILVAAESATGRSVERDILSGRIAKTAGAVTLLNPQFSEEGYAIFNDDGNGIEHFGYVDGRSQPLALVEDIDAERTMHGGITKWDPSIPLSQLLVKCPGGRLDVSFGSFFVFRKLEQNVRAFKQREHDLAVSIEKKHGLPEGSLGDRLGATVVGRFENGTPALLSEGEITPIAKGPVGVKNDFDYARDPDGLKCPYAAHIRKTNPRDDVPGSKSHLMARRGIPYGTRTDLNDPAIGTKPTKDVGLLFMAYQSSIEDQFEFTQVAWSNNARFPRPLVIDGPPTGRDPLTGQTAGPSGQQWPVKWGRTLTDGSPDDDFSGFVTLKGGEYFFAPSISFLKP